MAAVRFTAHLRRYFDLPDRYEVEASTVAEVVERLDAQWPGLGFSITDERGQLRQHVAVWVDGSKARDRATLQDAVPEGATADILQALSGGQTMATTNDRILIGTRKGLVEARNTGGESWQVPSNNLPLIDSLRFA